MPMTKRKVVHDIAHAFDSVCGGGRWNISPERETLAVVARPLASSIDDSPEHRAVELGRKVLV